MGQGLDHDGIYSKKTNMSDRIFASLVSDADISNTT
jgi:hypothetical protein